MRKTSLGNKHTWGNKKVPLREENKQGILCGKASPRGTGGSTPLREQKRFPWGNKKGIPVGKKKKGSPGGTSKVYPGGKSSPEGTKKVPLGEQK